MTTIQPRTSVVTIYQGDYLDRIRHLERQYDAAVAAEGEATRLLSDASLAADLKAEHDGLVAEAEKSALQVTVKALGRKAWRELISQHKPREGNKADADVGVNEDTFKDALVGASVIELTEDDLDQISDVDNDRLYYAAFALNRAPASDPKILVSPQSQANDETSN